MPYQILVVDDNEMNLYLITRILELEGYQVMPVQTGLDAIQYLTEHIPDLAILDVMMPDINGYALCQKIRQNPKAKDFPIVMLTAMNSEMERAQALEAGANDIWSKPFDLDMFRKWISKFLNDKPRESSCRETKINS
jgi:CheY-like chemotaxis protein